MKLDYEVAAIQALKSIFPSCKISGCFYHFTQYLWKKIQELGLAVDYKNNEEVRRMCTSLALIPVDNVEDGWLCIKETAPQKIKLLTFLRLLC